MDLREKYITLNHSFKPVLIYHVGIDAGFVTEYTSMVNAMLYCLENHIQFKLYSADANFGYRNGWSDYFAPFCDEVTESFNHRYNRHPAPSWKRIIREAWCKKQPNLLKWKIKTVIFRKIGAYKARRIYGPHTLLTHQIPFNPCKTFHIPELGIEGDYIHAFQQISQVAWKLNTDLQQEKLRLARSLKLPPTYAGIQVRGGDKVTEVRLLPPTYYAQIATDKLHASDVFVLTDDYTLFNQLEQAAPSVRWYTLCTPQEKGYVNSQFTQTRGNRKLEQMTRFLASMEILMHASVYAGSIAPGPSLFLLKRMYPAILPTDCSMELLSHAVTLPVAGRGKLAEEYLARKKDSPASDA